MEKNLVTIEPQFKKCTYILNKKLLEYSGSENFESLTDLQKLLIAERVRDFSETILDMRFVYCHLLSLQNIPSMDLYELKNELVAFETNIRWLNFDINILDDILHLKRSFKKEIKVLCKELFEEVEKLIALTDTYINLDAGYSKEKYDSVCGNFVVGADGEIDEDDEEEDDE